MVCMVTRGYSRGGINWETRIDAYILQYIKERTQNLLQNKFKKKKLIWVIQLIHFAVYLKLTQHLNQLDSNKIFLKSLQPINPGGGVEKREPTYTVGRNVKLVQPPWRTVWRVLKK